MTPIADPLNPTMQEVGAPRSEEPPAAEGAAASNSAPSTAERLEPTPDPDDQRWAPRGGVTHERVKETGRLVVHVLVPLCHNDQVVCGSARAGDPGDLDHNLYWGAIFGQKRFFSRKASKWTSEPVDAPPEGVLARAVFTQSFPGEPWARAAPVTAWIVFDAIHGDAIDGAIDAFFAAAEGGSSVAWTSSGAPRSFTADAIGYAGHNRMMDGKKPAAPAPARTPIPSFVMACYSKSWFEEALAERHSPLIASTRALMAPEGYVIDALAVGLAANADPEALRRRIAAAYAAWQSIPEGTALGMF